MIFIDRNRTDNSGKPIKPDDNWFKLSRKWTDDATQKGPAHQIQEHVYRHPSVKIALEELFHRKCSAS